MALDIVTFGCRLNIYESEVIRTRAQEAGLDNAVIINTCAVTAEAERQARQAIRKAKRAHPDARIIVTGCAAQIAPERYAAMAEVDTVLGNEEKLMHQHYQFGGGEEKIRVNDIMSIKETASHLVTDFDGKARAFVQIQNGCNHRCTFCIIPYGRGNSRSVALGEIAQQARMLVESGYKEIVLTGVDIGDWGKDLPGQPTLGQMVKRLLALVPELPRLRLSSIDVVEVDEELHRLIAEEERLMPHLHLSLQAGDNMILKRMKRRHLREDALRFAERVLKVRSDIVFGADLIAGFPTETDAMFENSLKLVNEMPLTWLHVFPYSAREGTPAARMPQVEKPVRKARAAQLREAGAKRVERYLASQIGSVVSAVVEKEGLARTEHYAPIAFEGAVAPGEIVTLRVTGADKEKLLGRGV